MSHGNDNNDNTTDDVVTTGLMEDAIGASYQKRFPGVATCKGDAEKRLKAADTDNTLNDINYCCAPKADNVKLDDISEDNLKLKLYIITRNKYICYDFLESLTNDELLIVAKKLKNDYKKALMAAEDKSKVTDQVGMVDWNKFFLQQLDNDDDPFTKMQRKQKSKAKTRLSSVDQELADLKQVDIEIQNEFGHLFTNKNNNGKNSYNNKSKMNNNGQMTDEGNGDGYTTDNNKNKDKMNEKQTMGVVNMDEDEAFLFDEEPPLKRRRLLAKKFGGKRRSDSDVCLIL